MKLLLLIAISLVAAVLIFLTGCENMGGASFHYKDAQGREIDYKSATKAP